jgi:Nif-specific regulatory protein
LSDAFIEEIGRAFGRPPAGISREAQRVLLQYHWPGNVRELRNVIERSVALGLGPVLDAQDIWLSSVDLGSASGENSETTFQPCSLEEVEKRHILKTLQHTDWNKSQAAAILGIERSTLDRKIKAYQIKRDGAGA